MMLKNSEAAGTQKLGLLMTRIREVRETITELVQNAKLCAVLRARFLAIKHQSHKRRIHSEWFRSLGKIYEAQPHLRSSTSLKAGAEANGYYRSLNVVEAKRNET